MPATFASQYNTFVPNLAATQNMIVDFSRNPKSFKLADYVQYVPVSENVGVYVEMTVEMAGRLVHADLQDLIWPDNADAPSGVGNTESFEFKTYKSIRYAFPYQLGALSVEQASWNILAQHGRIHAQRAMTARTLKVVGNATNTATYAASHTADVTTIGTGRHDQSTTARKDIKRSLDYGADVIQQATLSAVTPDQLIFVCSPGYARKIAACQEIVDHIKGSETAREEIERGLGPNSQYGLPTSLYGYQVRVENTVRVTSRKGQTKATEYVMPDAKPFLCARVGGLEAPEGPNFSTHVLFLKEEMTVEEKFDKDNRNHKGRIVDDFAAVTVAPISGFLFQNAVG